MREGVINGATPLETLMHTHPGEIKAQIFEENGQVFMTKTCPKHGEFKDLMATDARFLERIESLFFGRDFRSAEDTHVHKHGTSNIQFGRGAVLTVDLTNRCNMMCNPCFMDANQVGYVHEPTFEDTKTILDNAVSFKPRRQIIILFSGGEPTLSPYFLDAVAYAKKVGFYRILAATNGIRYAEDIEFCKAAKEAGQHGVYLQFDGVSEEKNKHRGVGNLFDVKLRAIENLASVGIKVTLVTTIVNTINNDDIGRIVEFAAQNIDKVQTIAFQPVSFTGRDEDVPDAIREQQRYTLAGMATDLEEQLGGRMKALRDWFPLSSYSAFTSVMDMLQGADAPWGWSSCNCHPNCGIFTLAVVNRHTGEFKSLFDFFDYEQFMKDVTVITDTARGKKLTMAQLGDGHHAQLPAGARARGLPRLADHQPLQALLDQLELRPQRPHEAEVGRRGRRVARPLRRGHVVPGPLQLRLPPHRDVRHPLRHAGGRDLLLRLQHGRRLAADHREHAQDGGARRVVQGARPPPRLRQGQARPRHPEDALPEPAHRPGHPRPGRRRARPLRHALPRRRGRRDGGRLTF